MKIGGSVGIDNQILKWPLWPQDGFAALQTMVAGNEEYGTTSSETDLNFWIIDRPDQATPPDGAPIPSWVDGVRFFGKGLSYDEQGALIGGTITGFVWFDSGRDIDVGIAASVGASELSWDVFEINKNPTEFWQEIFDSNDQFVYHQGSASSVMNLGNGDDTAEITNPMPRFGGGVSIDMGAGDDFFRDATYFTGWSDAHPGSLKLGEGFDDVEMNLEGLYPLRYIKDFNPNEDRIKFLNVDGPLVFRDIEGGVEIKRPDGSFTDGTLFLSGVSASEIKIENGYLSGINGRDYSRHLNDADITQHLHGTTNKDVFVLEGKRDDYRWHATDDGKGIVIWDVKTETPDLLYDFEVLRFNDVSLQLSEWPTSEGPVVEGIRDIADQTQYLQAEEWGETFIIDGKMSDYQWAPTQDRTATVVWNVKTGKHDILTDFAWINFNDGKADLVQYPRSNAPTTTDQASKDEIVKSDNHREVFEIDGYRDDYSWGPNPDGEGIAIWNGSNIDILIGFDGVRFLDSYADLRTLPQWGDVPRPNGEILIKDDPTDNQYLRGETGEEIFVFDGDKGDYNWGPTRDGKGVVVWNQDGFDILMDFKAVRFNDGTITTNEIRGIDDGNVSGVKIKDIASETQYLRGEGDKDQFIIDGNAEDYAWGATRDETGFVVWNRETKVHDILTDFEEVVFNDQVLVIDDVI